MIFVLYPKITRFISVYPDHVARGLAFCVLPLALMPSSLSFANVMHSAVGRRRPQPRNLQVVVFAACCSACKCRVSDIDFTIRPRTGQWSIIHSADPRAGLFGRSPQWAAL